MRTQISKPHRLRTFQRKAFVQKLVFMEAMSSEESRALTTSYACNHFLQNRLHLLHSVHVRELAPGAVSGLVLLDLRSGEAARRWRSGLEDACGRLVGTRSLARCGLRPVGMVGRETL